VQRLHPSLEFFPEGNAGIHQEQSDDDEKIFPVMNQGRKNRRNLNHPRDRTPEIGEKF